MEIVVIAILPVCVLFFIGLFFPNDDSSYDAATIDRLAREGFGVLISRDGKLTIINKKSRAKSLGRCNDPLKCDFCRPQLGLAPLSTTSHNDKEQP